MKAVHLCLAALTFSMTAHAGTTYQVKGEATLQASPDVATIGIPFLDYADSREAVLAHVRDAAREMIGKLEKAGVAERNIEWGGENDAVQIHDKAGATKFAALQFVNVTVRDFSTLPKLNEVVAANRADWNVSYSFADRTKFADVLSKAALADAVRKADRHANGSGVKRARMTRTGKLRICEPSPIETIPDCVTVGEPPGTEEVVVTARRRDDSDELPRLPHEKFQHAGPVPQTLTATMDVTFELR